MIYALVKKLKSYRLISTAAKIAIVFSVAAHFGILFLTARAHFTFNFFDGVRCWDHTYLFVKYLKQIEYLFYVVDRAVQINLIKLTGNLFKKDFDGFGHFDVR